MRRGSKVVRFPYNQVCHFAMKDLRGVKGPLDVIKWVIYETSSDMMSIWGDIRNKFGMRSRSV